MSERSITLFGFGFTARAIARANTAAKHRSDRGTDTCADTSTNTCAYTSAYTCASNNNYNNIINYYNFNKF